MKIYAAMKASERSVKLTDCIDTCWPDITEFHAHDWSLKDLRRYIRVMRQIQWEVDTTDVRDLLNGLYRFES